MPSPPPGAAAALTPAAAEDLADMMFALATPSRLQILDCLRAGPLSVSEIVERVGMEQSAVSHQLRVLREHDVLGVQRSGRRRLYSLRSEHVAEVLSRGLDHVAAVHGIHAAPRGLRGRRIA